MLPAVQAHVTSVRRSSPMADDLPRDRGVAPEAHLAVRGRPRRPLRCGRRPRLGLQDDARRHNDNPRPRHRPPPRRGVRGDAGRGSSASRQAMDRGAGVPKGLSGRTTKESAQARWWAGVHVGAARVPPAARRPLAAHRGSRPIDRAPSCTRTRASTAAKDPPRILGKDDVDALASWGVAGPNVVLAHGVQLSRGADEARGRARHPRRRCSSANLQAREPHRRASWRCARPAWVVGIGADGAPCNSARHGPVRRAASALLAEARRDDAGALGALDAARASQSFSCAPSGIDPRGRVDGVRRPTSRWCASMRCSTAPSGYGEPSADTIARDGGQHARTW